MQLAAWLKSKNNMPLEVLADGIGVDISSASRYANGLRIPRKETMRRIVQFTNGAVTADDFMTEQGEGDAPPAEIRRTA